MGPYMVFAIRPRSRTMSDSRRAIRMTMIFEGIIIMGVRKGGETI